MNKLVRKSLLTLGLYDTVVDFKHWLTNTESKYVNLYSQFVNEGDLCFDVGANVGRRTKVLLKLKAKVVAIEPQTHCINILKKKYKNNTSVTLVEKAVGEKEGQVKMMICDTHSLSSLSKDWVDSVKDSGRYSNQNWEKGIAVPVVTLDGLISQYGKPAFIKIDVEGYEYEVLKGFSQPVKVICFEFHSEVMDSAIKGIRHLSEIGTAQFNYCIGDKPVKLVLSEWAAPQQICDILESLRDKVTNGDIYTRFDLNFYRHGQKSQKLHFERSVEQ